MRIDLEEVGAKKLPGGYRYAVKLFETTARGPVVMVAILKKGERRKRFFFLKFWKPDTTVVAGIVEVGQQDQEMVCSLVEEANILYDYYFKGKERDSGA